MISLLLMKQITELFLVMVMGFVLVKTHLLKAEESKSLSIVALYLVMPCVIINAFYCRNCFVSNTVLLFYSCSQLRNILLFQQQRIDPAYILYNFLL